MAGILDALKLIKEQLPKFASEIGIPFSADQASTASVATGKRDPALDEKRTLETLLTLGTAALPIAKLAKTALSYPTATGAATALATGNPLDAVTNPILALALQSENANAALLPRFYYHGTRKAFDEFLPGLKFFTSSPEVAATYASGAGGNRGVAKTALFVDSETGYAYEQSGDILKQVTGAGKGRELPADLDELADLGIYPSEDWNKVAQGANIRKVNLDVNNMIDARFKGYDRYGKSPSIAGLSEIDPKGNKWAISVVEEAKKGRFDWSNTKYPGAQKAWEDIIIPQLKEKGYDAISYWDDMHDTVAVFDNASIKRPVTFNPTEAQKDEAVANILKFIQEQGNK